MHNLMRLNTYHARFSNYYGSLVVFCYGAQGQCIHGAWLCFFLAVYIGGLNLLRLLDSFVAGWRFNHEASGRLGGRSRRGCDWQIRYMAYR